MLQTISVANQDSDQRTGIVGRIIQPTDSTETVTAKVQAMKRSAAKEDPIAQVVYGNSKAELQQMFASCDYILCAMPLTTETQGMIGKEEFDAAKDGAVFINVGRGPIVDEKAMIEALQDGRLKGVGLDVFSVEPLPTDSPLWSLDNVLLSPHSELGKESRGILLRYASKCTRLTDKTCYLSQTWT